MYFSVVAVGKRTAREAVVVMPEPERLQTRIVCVQVVECSLNLGILESKGLHNVADL